MEKKRILLSLKKTTRTFINILPIIFGMLLLTSLVITLFPQQISSGLFGNGEIIDALIAGSIGSVAIGHPLASYLVGGELLKNGVSLVAVTALLVTWVSVGFMQLPAEMMVLGKGFAILRNVMCFISAIVVAFLVSFSLGVFN
jgi:hypothetical protein